LSWFRGLFCDGFIEGLDIGIVDEFFFLLRYWVCFVGVFAGFEGLHDSDCVEFGKLDSACDFGVQGSPDGEQFEEGSCCLEGIGRLPCKIISYL
jgi:hypothetical protein